MGCERLSILLILEGVYLFDAITILKRYNLSGKCGLGLDFFEGVGRMRHGYELCFGVVMYKKV